MLLSRLAVPAGFLFMTINERGLVFGERGTYGGTFECGQLSGPCSVGPVAGGFRLTPGGASPGVTTVVVIRKSVVPGAIFQTGQSVATKDKRGVERNLKIESLGATAGVDFWELLCNDVNQNA